MTEPFLISDDRLRTLSATRQGRVSIAGYNYQAAYAVARLASMCIRQPVLDLEDWPDRIRYDWGEDLDETQHDNIVRFTQCKRVASIGQPASLAEVLAGFAVKWLWVQESERNRLRFRLVCPDPRFATGGTSLDALKGDVREHFLARLKKTTGSNSDRAAWIGNANAVGHDTLFEALWGWLDCVYLPADVVDSEPAGARLAAEKEALRVLLERGRIDPAGQTQVLGRLRRLIHDNLISFDPTNESLTSSLNRSPRRLDRADVNAAIDPWRSTTGGQSPFQLIDRTFLSETRELERQQFVARQPDWSDVAHGHDETIKFIERDQTEALETAVLEKVVARLGRGGRLPALFVTGAPGDGKTTIGRRVAARLVDAGELLIADTGVGLKEPPGEPDEYVQAIERLQAFGRPVVLILDDPLYADSPWFEVLKKLNRPGLQVGVLAATPQFLFDEHKTHLRACDVSTFAMARTSQIERESLAALYGRLASSRTEEDFLVVAMETAAGIPFREIIDRLWLTLADGRDLSFARSLSDLPWQARAYLFVCFFSRAYEPCPEALLLKLLEITGAVTGASDVRTELDRLKYFDGWRIFRIAGRARATWDFTGPVIMAAHTWIARQAWEQRPLAWLDVSDTIIEASIGVPKTANDVSHLAVRLGSPTFIDTLADAEGNTFAKKLIARWGQEAGIETRDLYNLITPFLRLGFPEVVRPLRETLTSRATPSPQGWLAALHLWQLCENSEKQREFLGELDLQSLIESADFSIARAGATRLGQRLKSHTALFDAFVARLLDAFDGKLAWNLDTILVTYVLSNSTPQQLLPRVSQIMAWLDEHPDDHSVRTQYLALMTKLPAQFSNLRVDAGRKMAKWLEEHPEDTNVRTNYLSFLLKLPAEFWKLRADAALQTAKWLEDHPEDTSVRANYLSFLLKLPAEFSELRGDAARQTAKWLQEHPEDTSVRTQFLIFLSGMKPVGEWQRLATEALNDAADLVARSGYQTRLDTVATSCPRLYLALLRSLKLHESEVVRKVLNLSHDVIAEWRMRNPSAGLHYELPLPQS